MSFIVRLEQELEIHIDASRFIHIHNLVNLVDYLSTCEKKKGETLHDEILKGRIVTPIEKFYNPIARFFLFCCKYLSMFFWKLKVQGKNNLLVDNSVFIANHQSYLDILWILGAIPNKQRKDLYIIGKKELSFLNSLFPGLRIIFVDRKADVFPALKAGADILRKGKSLFVFPEGTRTKTGSLGKFKSGSLFLSYNLKKKIIPITVNGAFSIFPPQKRFPKLFTKQRASLIVHPPLKPDNHRSVEDLTKTTRKIIEKSLS